MTTLLKETSSPGKYILIETRTFTGGPNKGKTWDFETTVYNTKILAGEAAKEKMNDWSNLVFLGLETKEYQNTEYYYPAFNVFD